MSTNKIIIEKEELKISIEKEEIKQIKISEKTVRMFVYQGIKWFCARDILSCIGMKNNDTSRSRLRNINSMIVNILKQPFRPARYIDYNSVRNLLLSSRKIKNVEMRELFSVDINTSPIVCAEGEIGYAIRETFKELNFISQYKVENGRSLYHIDFYFPDQKIAIEVDECGHKDYKDDILRQKFIEDKLRCTFIRCNPDEIGFNIFSLIHKIRMEMKNKNIS